MVKRPKEYFLIKNSKNCIEEQKTIEPYKLGQEMQATSYRSHQIQWVSIY